jgi:tetratricopeptide (TPR) repeat protein
VVPGGGEFAVDLDGQVDGYRLRVSSPEGEYSADVKLDLAHIGADPKMLQARVLASTMQSGSVDPQLERTLRRVGQALFKAVFTAQATALLVSSRNAAERTGGKLRIVLRLRPPELAVLPWELLYSDLYGGYLSRRSTMVRYVDVFEPVRPLTVTSPLRVLGMTALPADLDLPDADSEQRRLQELLAPAQERGLVAVDWVPGQSWKAAQEQLYAGYHVFHFIGHGGFDPDRGEGVIAFADERGRRQLVRAPDLVDLLSVGDAMPQLVVLNSCQTGAGGDVNVFSSTAATLVRRVPAVVAMQFAITDGAAAVFSSEFYQALVHNRGVDEAVRTARIALSGWNTETLEWATPVLYLRSRDTRLFDFTQPARVEAPLRRPRPNFDLPSPAELQRFVGRDRELAMCREKLSADRFLIIYGLDGQGKTALAKVYAAKYHDDYDVIWFVPSSQDSSISTKLELLASKLEVDTASEPDTGRLLYALRERLKEWGRWLLIFDDVRDWKSIERYIPSIASLGGHVIATTQDTRGAQEIPDLLPGYLRLEALPLAASKKYLMDYIEGASDADAERLAHDLGNFPFALKLAARKYATTGIPATPIYNDTSHELKILWQDTFDRLRVKSPLAHSLLELCSLFASDPIPEMILTLRPAGNEPPDELREALTNPSKYSDLVRTLRERSLLEAQPGSRAIGFHSLLQAYMRENMTPSRRDDLLPVAIGIMLDAFYESWFSDNFSRCALALPHAEACLAISERYEIAFQLASRLMVRIAHYHRTRGEIFKAYSLHERALKAREKAFGKNSIQVARSLNDLGIVLTEIGRPGEAVKKYNRALKIEMGVKSPDEEFIAICRDNLGIAQAANGEYAQAIECHKLAYYFWDARNPQHSNVAEALDNMGFALYLLGDLPQAEMVLRKAVKIGREALGVGFDEMGLAGMLHNLGQVLRAQGGVYDAWRAKAFLGEALAVRSKDLGDQHPSVIETRMVLARVFRCQGEYARAADELKSAFQAIDGIRRSDTLGFGPAGSPDLSSKYECAFLIAEGELRFALGNNSDAKQSFQRANELTDTLATQGVPLPLVEHAELMENLGRVYNAESPSFGEHWLEQAAASRDALDRIKAGAPKIPEEVER